MRSVLAGVLWIQIQPMLRLNVCVKAIMYSCQRDSNTTNVKVKLYLFFYFLQVNLYSNTTNVKVKLQCISNNYYNM